MLFTCEEQLAEEFYSSPFQHRLQRNSFGYIQSIQEQDTPC